MKNLYLTPIDFWKERDFGAKITAMFEFIGAHWRPLGKCLVYFVLPGALLAGIGLGVYNNSAYNQAGAVLAGRRAGLPMGAGASSPFAGSNVWGLVVGALGFLVTFLLLLSTVYGYLRARLRLPATEVATPRLVWAAMRERLGRMLLVWLVVFGVYVVLGGAIAVGATLVIGAQPASAGPLIFLLFLVALPLIAYLIVVLSLYFPVLWLEDRSIFSAVARSLQLIRGHWWATFGLLLVALFLQGAVGIVFALPQYAVTFGKLLQIPLLNSDVLGLIGHMIYTTGLVFTYPIALLTIAFQYFNLAEQREGYGLRLLVDGLGQAAPPEALSHHYRPEEEQY